MSATYSISVHEVNPEMQGEYPLLAPTGRKIVATHFLHFQIDSWSALQRQFFFPEDFESSEEEELGYERSRRVSVFQNTPLHLVGPPSWLGQPDTGWTHPIEFKNLSFGSKDLNRKHLDEDELLVVRLLKLISKLPNENFVVFVSRV